MADYWDINTGEPLEDSDLEGRYDEMLDSHGEDAYPGLNYPYSRVLKEVDIIAYRVGFNDWLDSELGETITEEEPTDDTDEEN